MMNLIARTYTISDFNGCLAIFDSNVPTFFAAGEREEFCDFLLGKSGVEGFYLVLTLGEDIIACGGLTIDAKKASSFFIMGNGKFRDASKRHWHVLV